LIPGREIYASVLGNEDPQVLPLVEWPMKSGHSIGSYDAKWKAGHEHYRTRADTFPDDLAPSLVERIQREAIAAYRALELTGYARFDIRLALDGTPYFLEANANPYFDPTAETAMAARAAGLDYAALAERVLDYALERRPAARAQAA
jgi:D-alanine-D-alanine ligase